MVVIGLWLAILGYGVAFSGVVQLQGGTCSLADAFRGRCQPKRGGPAPSGETNRDRALRQQETQYTALPTNAGPAV